MDCFFHCSKRALKNTKSSKHRVSECCDTLKLVLAGNPEYGAVIKGRSGLRKMRIKVPSLNVGKSGGYRLIYKSALLEGSWRIVLLATYFKGDCEDLSNDEYKTIQSEAESVFAEVDATQWDSA